MLGQAKSHSRDVHAIKIGDLPSPLSPRKQRAFLPALGDPTVKITCCTETLMEDFPLIAALIERSSARNPHAAHLGGYC